MAQTALLKVFARASEFTPGRGCLPWFYAIVANEMRASRRATHRLAAVVSGRSSCAERERDAGEQLSVTSSRLRSNRPSRARPRRRADHRRAPRSRAAPELPSPTFRKRVSRAYAKLRMLLGPNHVD